MTSHRHSTTGSSHVFDSVGRNQATIHMMEVLGPNPKLDGVAADISNECWDMACAMTELLSDGPELTTGLGKLREAKDCFVMQAILDTRTAT